MSGSWTRAARRWSAGEEAAQFELQRLMQSFLLSLLGKVRSDVPERLRPRIHSEGVIQDAFKSFLSGVPKHEFPHLESREDMKKVMTRLVECALKDEIRRHRRRKRDAGREAIPAALDGVASSRADTNLDLVEWLNEITEMMRGVHPRAIELMELLLQDLTTVEIAERMQLRLRTVQKIRQSMAEAWYGDRGAD